MVIKQDSREKTSCEKDIDTLKYQCKKIFFTLSRVVEDIVEQIDEETSKKKKDKQKED